MSKFTERFQELRKASNKTQAAIATDLELTPQTLSYYANGREPNYETLIKLADYFKVSTDYLLGVSDAKTPENESLVTDLGLTDKNINFIKSLNHKFFGSGDLEKYKSTLLDVFSMIIDNEDETDNLLTFIGLASIPEKIFLPDLDSSPSLVNNLSYLYKGFEKSAHDTLDLIIQNMRNQSDL